jgi:hypothetical protein
MIARLISRLRGREQASIHAIFYEYEWDRNGDALLSGNLSSLDQVQQAAVRRITEELQKLGAGTASAISQDTLAIYAIGLIARKTGNRLAARFARRALNGAPDWVLAYRA